MSTVPGHLARGLDVRVGERAVAARLRRDRWEVDTQFRSQLTAEVLVLTAPVPQSLALFSEEPALPEEARRRLEAVSYSPCLALMALIDGPTGVPEPGGVQVKGEPLDWIGDNRRKGISLAPGVTIHAGPEWSRAHFDEDETRVAASLLAFAGEQLRTDLTTRVLATSLARWRYSWVTRSIPEPCLVARREPPLIFAGDAFGPSKVEGAALSGLAAADHLLHSPG
jgi:predicted NAD/FAD-dependent oxidoreductase